MLLRKTLERASFGKRGRSTDAILSPPSFLDKMTQDIQIAKFAENGKKFMASN